MASYSAPGRIDAWGGVADYSGSWVLQVATKVCTTVTPVVSAASGAVDSVSLTSDTFGTVVLPLAPLRTAVAAAPSGGALTPEALKAIRTFLEEQKAPGWAFYVYGSVAAFALETGWLPKPDTTLSLAVTSTVPTAQGVSSSASIEVATLRALIGVSGITTVTPLRVAHVAQAAENYVVGAPCGLMDQLASSLGTAGKVLPILCRPDGVEAPVALPQGVVVVGWPSGVKHSVAASPYLTARTATFMAKKVIEQLRGGAPLRHITELTPSELLRVLEGVPEALSGAEFAAKYGAVDDALSVVKADEVYTLRAAARFPVEENFRGSTALALLRSIEGAAAGDARVPATLCLVGEMMRQTHRGYSTIGLGCAEVDTMIQALTEELGEGAGVYGARMSGGGSGGTVAILCEERALPAIEKLAQRMTFGEPFTGLIQ